VRGEDELSVERFLFLNGNVQRGMEQNCEAAQCAHSQVNAHKCRQLHDLDADGYSLYFNVKITDKITFSTLYPFTFCSLLYNTFLLQEYVDIEIHSNLELKLTNIFTLF
jgi:hypothetical protein